MSNERSTRTILLFATLLVVIAFAACRRQNTSSEEPHREIPKFPDRDLQILETEFPGFVLPLERPRLARQLDQAIVAKDASRVTQLLSQGASVNGNGNSGRASTLSPLFRAIKCGNPEVVEALLEHGARVGKERFEVVASRNQFSQTPLYFAVRTGSKEIVELLLDRGALIDAPNGYGKTAIVGAIENGDLEMFNYLLTRGGVCDFESHFGLDRAPSPTVLHGQSDEFLKPPFDDRSSQVNGSLVGLAKQSENQDLINAVTDQFNASPVFGVHLQAEQAVRMGDATELRKLIDNGYAPSEYESGLIHPSLLDMAVGFGFSEVTQILIDAGAKQKLSTLEKKPIHLVIESGSVDGLKRLLSQGVRLESADVMGRVGGRRKMASPLELAVRSQRTEMIHYLLRRPEAQREWLPDPHLLLSAMPHFRNDSRSLSESVCISLIEAGAKVGFDNLENPTADMQPSILAARAGWLDAYKRIVKRLPPEKVNYTKALQAAAYGNHLATCRYLIGKGADVNGRELAYSFSPLEHAMANRNQELYSLLLSAGAREQYRKQKNVSIGYNSFEEYGHPLYQSALVGDVDFCEFLLKRFAPQLTWQTLQSAPYEYDSDTQYFSKGNSPLFAPVYGDHWETMDLLLDYGLKKDDAGKPLVDINAQNVFGATALHEAVNYGAANCVQLLLVAGADPTIRRNSGNRQRGGSPLHQATFCLDPGSNESPARGDAQTIFQMLIGANIRNGAPDWPDPKCGNGFTPLHRHARAANTEVCLKLIELGANVNATSNDGTTPLQMAINPRTSVRRPKHERGDLCIELVKAGAKFNRKSQNGRTFYALAYKNGLFDFCKFLETRGVDPEIAANAGQYLCAATQNKRADLLKELIDKGANVNSHERRGNTALHWAVINRDLEFCKMLLDLGADPNAVGEYGNTTLFSVFDRFANHTKDFNTPNPRKAKQEAFEIMQLLVDAGADPRIKNKQDRTVLEAYSEMPSEFRDMLETYREPGTGESN